MEACWICKNTIEELIQSGFNKEDISLTDHFEYNVKICTICTGFIYEHVDVRLLRISDKIDEVLL